MPRPARVLIVDDSPENLLALRALMAGLPVTVTSGEQALKHLLVEEYAVLLLDACMPGLDGFATARYVRQRQRTRKLPIIFLIVDGQQAHPIFCGDDTGVTDYLTRPFDPWALRSTVTTFAHLWHCGVELAAHAQAARTWEAEALDLRSAIDDALGALSSAAEGDDTATSVQRARARLRRVRPTMQLTVR